MDLPRGLSVSKMRHRDGLVSTAHQGWRQGWVENAFPDDAVRENRELERALDGEVETIGARLLFVTGNVALVCDVCLKGANLRSWKTRLEIWEDFADYSSCADFAA